MLDNLTSVIFRHSLCQLHSLHVYGPTVRAILTSRQNLFRVGQVFRREGDLFEVVDVVSDDRDQDIVFRLRKVGRILDEIKAHFNNAGYIVTGISFNYSEEVRERTQQEFRLNVSSISQADPKVLVDLRDGDVRLYGLDMEGRLMRVVFTSLEVQHPHFGPIITGYPEISVTGAIVMPAEVINS